MKVYIWGVIWVAIFAMCYGFLVPSMVSAKDSVGVAIGFAIAVIGAPCGLYLIGKYAYVKHIKKGDEE